MKKIYNKPAMEIIPAEIEAPLLVGSSYPPGHGGEYGYTPGDATDMNSMA